VVAEGVDPRPEVYRAIAAENNAAIASALVLDAERQELSLHCQATFDMTQPPGGRLDLFRTAVALQAAVADLYGGALPLPAGKRPRIAHPASGYRDEPSDLVKAAIPVIRQQSAKIPQITRAELDAIQAQLEEVSLWSIAGMGRLSLEVEAASDSPRIWFVATNGQGGPWNADATVPLRGVIKKLAKEQKQDPAVFHQILWRSVEGPEAPETGALRISTVDDHPVVGKGVLMLLLLPGRFPASLVGQLVNALNLLEMAPPVPLTQFGAWSARETGDDWEIGHSGFVPATFTGTQGSDARVDMIADLAGEIALRGRIGDHFIREAYTGIDG
jgi:hypothetical protein